MFRLSGSTKLTSTAPRSSLFCMFHYTCPPNCANMHKKQRIPNIDMEIQEPRKQRIDLPSQPTKGKSNMVIPVHVYIYFPNLSDNKCHVPSCTQNLSFKDYLKHVSIWDDSWWFMWVISWRRTASRSAGEHLDIHSSQPQQADAGTRRSRSLGV